jgi:GTP-binding protein
LHSGSQGIVKIQQIEAAYRSRRPDDYPPERLPEIAFLGRSNVGKSSLINSLLNRKKLAATSKTPGKTREIAWYRLSGATEACFFVDLPGYGYAKIPKQIREEVWAQLIDTYLLSDRPLALAIQLLDIRRGKPTELDEQMIHWLREARVPHIFALTKSDKLKKGPRAQAAQEFAEILGTSEEDAPVPFSAVTAEGKRELWSLIDQRLAQFKFPSSKNDDAFIQKQGIEVRRA